MITYDLIACPACGGDLYRSRRQGFLERYIFGVFQFRAYRCHRCRSRYMSLPTLLFRKRDPEDEKERRERKRRRHSEGSSAPHVAGADSQVAAQTPPSVKPDATIPQ